VVVVVVVVVVVEVVVVETIMMDMQYFPPSHLETREVNASRKGSIIIKDVFQSTLIE